MITIVDDGDAARQTYEELVASKKYVPWALRPQGSHRENSHAFGAHRDVVPTITPIL